MAWKLHWFGAAAVAVALSGCVPQEKYNALKLANDDLTQRLANTQADEERDQAQAAAYKSQLDQLGAGQNNYTALVNNLTQQVATLTQQNSDLNSKLADALGKEGTIGSPLPQALSSALSDFASANPDLVDFDAAHGTVKFKSDVLFAPGSSELTPSSRDVINRFSSILNSSAAEGYELMVCGHTDSTPVVNPETIRHGNKDNWYLSANRAIAVGKELIASRVSPQRIAVVGYADQRPVASNATASGKAQNRRVEVVILPTTVRGSSVAESDTATPTHHRQAADMNKDDATAGTDRSPAMDLNK